jgi:putative MATE family efflux protein
MIRETQNFFGSASFYRSALSIVIPVMAQTLITGLVSLIDNFMVAALGDSSMAGVNVANQINFVYLVVINTVCIAGGIYLSQHRGAQDKEGMQQAFRFKIIMATGLSVVYFIVCQFWAEPLILLMLGGNSQGQDIVVQGAQYLRIVSISFVPIGMSSAISTSFRDLGVTKVPLAVSVTAALLNTFLNWLLIYGNLGAPRLEVTGAAIATAIARIFEASLFIGMVIFRKPDFSFPLRTFFQINRGLFREILSRSGIMLFSETAWVLSETVITALYNGRGGSETVAGMAAGWTMANIMFLVFPAIHASTNVIVGSTLGAGKLDEGKQKAKWIMSGSIILGLMAAVVASTSTLIIPLVFANLSDSAQKVTRGLVFVIAAYLPIWCLLNAQFAVSRAGGDTLMGVWVDVGVSYTLFIPAAILLARYTSIGPVALFGLAKIFDLPKALVAAWWLKKERWVKNLSRKNRET